MVMFVNWECVVIRCIILNSIVKVWVCGEIVKYLRYILGIGIFYIDYFCFDIDFY